MTKKHGRLFEQIISRENLLLAFKRAARGKHWRRAVKSVERHLDGCMDKLRKALESGTFHTSPYRTKTIYEPKERLIYILPFYPDRILHHAIMNVLEPIFDGMMYANSFACRKGKGQHAGSRKCMQYVRQYKYCLQCDVSKFYPSVDHAVLKALLAHKFKDAPLLALLYEVIDSAPGGKNVPIGNYLSQWFGNFYLTELDRYAYETLHVKAYLRYCDDFCIFDDDKSRLKEIADGVEAFLGDRLKLRLSKRRVYPTAQGVDFLGYRHFPGYILLRKRTAKRIRRNMRGVMWQLRHRMISKDQARSKVASAYGWIKHAQTYHLRRAIGLDELAKEVIDFGGEKEIQ
ncbi:MAG: hypothetical protein J5974_01450 [Pyramidobacter sp.]|nr:hypothetical protein [Pyramidobacter sp.]